MSLPVPAGSLSPWLAKLNGIIGEHLKVAIEYSDNLNYQPDSHSIRTMILLSSTMDNVLQGWDWR